MKSLLFFLLLLPVAISAQRDFDYTFYTTQTGWIDSVKKDTMDHLSAYKRIDKVRDVITISSTINSGNTQSFEVNFAGWDARNYMLLYQAKDQKTFISINPIGGVVRIASEGKVIGYY